jgi:hypothetical protein
MVEAGADAPPGLPLTGSVFGPLFFDALSLSLGPLEPAIGALPPLRFSTTGSPANIAATFIEAAFGAPG